MEALDKLKDAKETLWLGDAIDGKDIREAILEV